LRVDGLDRSAERSQLSAGRCKEPKPAGTAEGRGVLKLSRTEFVSGPTSSIDARRMIRRWEAESAANAFSLAKSVRGRGHRATFAVRYFASRR
jgi:hypothetical protein